MARLFWVCCPKKSQLSSSCNKQISKSAYYSLCSREQCLLSGICRFLGLVFCDFLAISLRMPFKNKCAIWGLILGLCFCRSPFLWRAIDFRFLLSRFRYFLWILEFLLLLLLCFSTSLLFCVFALLFSACMLFLLFRYFVFFLLFCFSAFLASLCSASLFFFLFFPASLLFYFSAFLFLLVFFCSHAFSWYFSRTKIRKPFPYFVLPLVEFELCKQL